MKRFSWTAFSLTVGVHVAGTIRLFDAGIAALQAEKAAAASALPTPSFLWLAIVSWIWYPIPRLIQICVGPLSESAFFYLTLLWSVCLGTLVGFLVPYFGRKRREIV